MRNLSPTVFASVAKDYRPSTPPSSRAQRGDPLYQTTGGGNVEQLRLPSHLSKN
ncbi:MAG: hypothetical protein ACO3NM_16595 [bacterium]